MRDFEYSLIQITDPTKLRLADVVITSYNIVTSEHGIFQPDIKDEANGKTKAKPKSASASDSDSGLDGIAKHLQKNKKPAKKSAKAKDALFRVKWWRIILG